MHHNPIRSEMLKGYLWGFVEGAKKKKNKNTLVF